MTNDISIELLGDEELLRLLDKLPARMSKSFVQGAWIKSAKPLKAAMKQTLPYDTGTARKSVTTVRGKSFKTPTVFVGPRQGRSRKAGSDAKFLKSSGASARQVKSMIQADAWYLKFLWRGTRYISPRTGLGSYQMTVERMLPVVKRAFAKELRRVIEKKL